MSCSEFKQINEKIVDRILEQGQKLRNAMVQSILKNDPFNTEIIYEKHYNTPQPSTSSLSEKKSGDTKFIELFLKGDYLTKDQEQVALDSIRTMSVTDVCKTTERMLSKCSCATCVAYNVNNNLKCDLRRTQDKEHCISNNLHHRNHSGNRELLKHVDTLKVVLQSIVLNDLGYKRVSRSSPKQGQISLGLNETYFVEYYVPEILTKELPRTKSKVNSGLDSNCVRVCARRTSDVIHLRQIFIHDIRNLTNYNLEDHEICFSVRFKSRGHKTSESLGVAKFNLGLFDVSKNFSSSRALSIHVNEESPIIVGTLKVTLQLGCGRIYFGQEFIDAVTSQKVTSGFFDSDDENSEYEKNYKCNNLKDNKYQETYIESHKAPTAIETNITNKNIPNTSGNATKNQCFQAPYKKPEKSSAYFSKSKHKPEYFCHRNFESQKPEVERLQRNLSKNNTKSKEFDIEISNSKSKTKPEDLHQKYESQKPEVEKFQTNFSEHKAEDIHRHSENQNLEVERSQIEKELLFGFIYISEAHFLSQSINSYINCKPFCQNDTSTSRLVYNSSNPLYNFCQSVPLLYEDNLLLKLRENFMVIEFYRKNDTANIIFGLTRLPLHQFYLAYRNFVILQHLKKNKLPIIGTDWWEPIYSTDNEELIGQVQVLTALGTEEQITNLETERGFRDDLVKAKFPTSTQVKVNLNKTQPSTYFGDRAKANTNKKPNDLNTRNKKVHTAVQPNRVPLKEIKSNTFDVGVQSDLEVAMEPKDSTKKISPTNDMFSSFLKLLEQRERPVCMENSTNTDPPATNTKTSQTISTVVPELRRTSDLLDSLQKALSLDSQPVKKTEKLASCFKAQISINAANHLPSRKKCRSRRSKGKGSRSEGNSLPSTYVTFETLPGDALCVTNVFARSGAPQWKYTKDVLLPVDLIVNGEKRLIFKVWKKSTNAVLQPNMQTDLILGFAALDLSVLLAGLPNVQGWFNIIDFSGKCNGQINIHVTPLENLRNLNTNVNLSSSIRTNVSLTQPTQSIQVEISESEECNELLSRALKRKFTELDEITQRLRLRLSEVVSDDSEGSNDGIADEFEDDINNLCIEEDFDLINFEEEARKLNKSYHTQKCENKTSTSNILSMGSQSDSNQESDHSGDSKPQESETNKDKTEPCSLEVTVKNQTSDNTQSTASSCSVLMDKHILDGKARIDTLLEKLSLISAEANQPFSSRYVSGCSVNNDNVNANDILKNLDDTSRPNITAGTSFDPVMFQQLYGGSMCFSSQSSNGVTERSGGSETSVISSFSDCRPNPDGQGTTSEDKGT